MATLLYLPGRHLTDDVFKCIFMNEKFCILIRISLNFVPKGPIDNKPTSVQVMAWRLTGDKPLSEPMLNQMMDAYMRHWGEMNDSGRQLEINVKPCLHIWRTQSKFSATIICLQHIYYTPILNCYFPIIRLNPWGQQQLKSMEYIDVGWDFTAD